MSALQLQRNLGLGAYKSAWHLCHRVRHAMQCGPLADLLCKLGSGDGVVKVDEAYIGCKPRLGRSRMERGWVTKELPIVALVERNDEARALALE
jgi:hypothetical protein